MLLCSINTVELVLKSLQEPCLIFAVFMAGELYLRQDRQVL